jgi:hypothetical protein
MELDVGVPSSSEPKILEHLYRSGVLVVPIVCCIDLWSEDLAIGIQARFVCCDPLTTFFLSAALDFTENAHLLVLV